jgi:hypothetical protein
MFVRIVGMNLKSIRCNSLDKKRKIKQNKSLNQLRHSTTSETGRWGQMMTELMNPKTHWHVAWGENTRSCCSNKSILKILVFFIEFRVITVLCEASALQLRTQFSSITLNLIPSSCSLVFLEIKSNLWKCYHSISISGHHGPQFVSFRRDYIHTRRRWINQSPQLLIQIYCWCAQCA